MLIDSCISFLIALNVVILTSNVLIFSLSNLRNQAENDYRDAVNIIKSVDISEKKKPEIIAKISRKLAIIINKTENIGKISVLNIYLIFIDFLAIFSRFSYKNIIIDYVIIEIMFFSLILLFAVIYFFYSIYNFNPKKDVRVWIRHHREKIEGKGYSSIASSGAFIVPVGAQSSSATRT